MALDRLQTDAEYVGDLPVGLTLGMSHPIKSLSYRGKQAFRSPTRMTQLEYCYDPIRPPEFGDLGPH